MIFVGVQTGEAGACDRRLEQGHVSVVLIDRQHFVGLAHCR